MRKCKTPAYVLAATFLVVANATAASITYDAQIDPGLFGNLEQNDVPGCASVACGPSAAVNSFMFLQNQWPDLYDDKLIPDIDNDGVTDYEEMVAAATALTDPAYMNTCCNNGTFVSDFIEGKRKWIEDHAPGVSHYHSEDIPGWQALYFQLTQHHASDLFLQFFDSQGSPAGGHFVTLSGFNFTDENDNGLIDGNESAVVGFIDPLTGGEVLSFLSEDASSLLVDYNIGNGVASTRILNKSSTVPEPSTFLLVITAVAGLAGRRKLFMPASPLSRN
jgi:hypothetical protein